MAADALVDTGAILALLDRTDRWHALCADTFRHLRLPLVTTEAVLTELFHLVGDTRHEVETAWNFLRSGAIRLTIIDDSELPEIQSLMSRYRDRPMSLADACLVRLAELHLGSVLFTLDADFRIYRRHGNKVIPVLMPEE